MPMNEGCEELIANAQSILRDDLRAVFASLQGRHAWSDDAYTALCAPGKLLAVSSPSMRLPSGFWALLPFLIATYCSSTADTWRPRRLAVALEMLMCALDYFDELEDADTSEVRKLLGDGRLLNCATALYQFALHILSELDNLSTDSSRLTRRLADIASEGLLHAMHGQHVDLLAEQRPWRDFDPEECLAIAEAKAGSLCRMVCQLAAVAANASDELVVLFAQIGLHIGTAAQIENDAHDLETLLAPSKEGAQPVGKSDLARGKKTLPLVLAATIALQKNDASADSQSYMGEEQNWPVQVYQEAIQAALGSAVYHRLSAASLVEQVEQLHGMAIPPGLCLLLGLDAW